SKEKILKLYKEKGDLGIVAEELMQTKKQQSLFSEKLSVQKVFQNFLKISNIKGAGTVDTKIKLLAELLNSSTALEAKYLVRMPLGNLRLGTGDPTLMESLADMFTPEQIPKFRKKLESEVKSNKEKKPAEFEEELYKKTRTKLREQIEEKYNIFSDLGEIAEKLKNKGLDGLKEITIQPGIPIRPTLAERLPNSEEIVKKLGKCFVEVKLDGFRVQCHKQGEKVTIFSRQSENMTHMFPDIVKAVQEQIQATNAIVEGEALAFKEETQEFFPFQITITRKRKYGISEAVKKLPLKLFLFDVMLIDSENLMELPFLERRKRLEKLLKKGHTIELTEAITTDKAEEIEKFFENAIERGLEGIIAKDLHEKYIAGARKFAWIKLKRSYKGELQDSADLVIIGYYTGRGKRTQFGLGALLTACYDEASDTFKSIAKIGTGMTEQHLQDLEKLLSKNKTAKKPSRVESKLEPDIWVEPLHVIEVRADEITKSPNHTCGKTSPDSEGYALRFPRMISF
ncbi:MAG: ATP-dependent DNA ligase, partial [Candidatus Diapherotrites archaeon]|nr:ATP-dependent DNA ligase [Candidatus Diapherotrites archaeon]